MALLALHEVQVGPTAGAGGAEPRDPDGHAKVVGKSAPGTGTADLEV